MSEESINESKKIIVYPESSPEPVCEKNGGESIRVAVSAKINPRMHWREILVKYWRFAAIATAFAAIFACIYLLCTDEFQQDVSSGDLIPNENTNITLEDTEKQEETLQASADAVYNLPEVIDESKLGIEISNYFNEDFSLHPLAGANDAIKVLIVHSHAAEYVSETVSVAAAGEAMAQLLNSAEIGTVHCITKHDSDGNIGAYERMRESVYTLIDQYEDLVLVIDLHDSDTGTPLTFTVGTGFDFGWKENLRLCAAISKKTYGCNSTIRLLPDDLGQNNGLLTVNVGIGDRAEDDTDVRKIIASVVNAIIDLFNENTPETTRGVVFS